MGEKGDGERERARAPLPRSFISLRTSASSLRLCGEKILLLLLLLSLFLNPLAFAQVSTYQPTNRQLTKDEEKWVRETLKALTLAEKIGQMFLADGNAIFMNRAADPYQQLEHHIKDNKVGGVLWFRSDVWATAVLTNRLQELSKLPLLISSDLEMGLGMRLNETQWWPPNMAVAATGEPKLALNQGLCTAREARAIGINWLFAPVVDVNNNPNNPVINVRSYSEDPQVVSDFAAAFVQGATGEGVLTCVKHFPGHGNTATDSHIGLPVVDASKDSLSKLEFVPFRALIGTDRKKNEEGVRVSAVMSAHISLPNIETEPAAPVRTLSAGEKAAAEFTSQTEANAPKVTKPATLSQKILTGILRDELKFAGLVVTDAMNMAGISARYDAATAAIEAIKAGVDVIEKSPDIDAAIRGVNEAVKKNEIPEARINLSVERILRAKAALGLHEKRTVDLDAVDRIVSSPGCQMTAQEIADRSITLVRDERKAVPLKPPARVLSVTFTDEEDRAVTQPFVSELRRRLPTLETIVLDLRTKDEEIKQVLERIDKQNFDAVIFASTVRARSGKGSVALPALGLRLAEELVKRNALVVSFGNPYLLQAIPQAQTYLAAYSPFPFSQRAAAKALLGESEITGKLPVSLPGLYPRGHGIEVKRDKSATR
jgi:beta-N-acetylhexosaminidase